MTPLTHETLLPLECPCGRCTPTALFLHAKCHPGKGVLLCYNKVNRVMSARCAKCNAPVFQFKVAED